jgi:hypothetical protein
MQAWGTSQTTRSLPARRTTAAAARSPCQDTGTGMDAPLTTSPAMCGPRRGRGHGRVEERSPRCPMRRWSGRTAPAQPAHWTGPPGGGGHRHYRFGLARGSGRPWTWPRRPNAAHPASSRRPHAVCAGAGRPGQLSASGTHTLTVSDSRVPAGAVVINGNAATTASSRRAGPDLGDGLNGSGVSRMRFSNDGITWSPGNGRLAQVLDPARGHGLQDRARAVPRPLRQPVRRLQRLHQGGGA